MLDSKTLDNHAADILDIATRDGGFTTGGLQSVRAKLVEIFGEIAEAEKAVVKAVIETLPLVDSPPKDPAPDSDEAIAGTMSEPPKTVDRKRASK